MLVKFLNEEEPHLHMAFVATDDYTCSQCSRIIKRGKSKIELFENILPHLYTNRMSPHGKQRLCYLCRPFKPVKAADNLQSRTLPYMPAILLAKKSLPQTEEIRIKDLHTNAIVLSAK